MTTSIPFATLLAASVHEMKNSVGMLVHLLQEQAQERGDSDPGCGQLQFEAARLNNYLMELMTLYKLEADQYALGIQETYLDEFLEDLALMNRPLLAPRGVSLDVEVAEELCWNFDPQLVQAALSTILTNQIRYARGRVQLDARLCDVENAQGAMVSRLCIRVADDGGGFPESMLGELAQQPLGVDFVSGSTGFGLYFALQVAQAHSDGDTDTGRVRLLNGEPLGGGCFELQLPRL